MVVPGGAIKFQLMQNAAVATGNGTAIETIDASSGAFTVLAMQVTGITTATITFEATIDGTNWVAVTAKNLNGGVEATTATADGIYTIMVAGLPKVRARVSAWTTGTIYVTGSLAA